jgi:hypothetical protein
MKTMRIAFILLITVVVAINLRFVYLAFSYAKTTKNKRIDATLQSKMNFWNVVSKIFTVSFFVICLSIFLFAGVYK